MRSSRKDVIGDGMDRQHNDRDRWRMVIRSQKQRQSRKKEPKSWILEFVIGTIFFNIVQSIQFIYTSLVKAYQILKVSSFAEWRKSQGVLQLFDVGTY